ncbi:MAG: hypothetical protein JWO89_3281 [Verrucomicrobiaceae bacterium]|nr:hypothetical protein [Verrucomicrobiaceae bacterium]
MRSQKQSNKAPRPFKVKNDQRGWSGGNHNNAFQLPGTSLVRAAKTTAVPSKAEAGAAESLPIKPHENSMAVPSTDMPVA